jgi:hypothetical protein
MKGFKKKKSKLRNCQTISAFLSSSHVLIQTSGGKEAFIFPGVMEMY